MSLEIPLDIADMARELRPELRKKLSWRDIDDVTRPFRKRIAELEAERDAFKRTLDKRDGERDKLRAAAKAIIDDAMFTGAPGSFYILMNGHLTEQGDCDRDGCAGTLFADLWAALKQESKP